MHSKLKRRKEYFRIRQFARRYDQASGKFVVSIAYETAAPKPSERVVAVAEGFGLGLDKWEKFVVYDNVELRIGPTDIVYITGDSGSGKSVLLKALERDIEQDMKVASINVADIRPEPDRPLIETVGRTTEEALGLLSRVGLNDAFLFLRSYGQLSDGQKYRYKIAKMIESQAQFWVLDEFCASLDRDTAKIVAFNVQKLARVLGKAVVAATTHTDLFENLKPSVHVHKRFGKEISVKYYSNEPAAECSLMSEMRVEQGTLQDWKQLASFHYRSHRVGPVRKIFSFKRGDELCGVIVYGYPPPEAFGRRVVMPRMSMKELNDKLSIISRVVVHPKYRSMGLGSKLVHDTLSLAGTECVEMPAVMAKYNPFAERAGMKKIVEQQPSKDVQKVTDTLQRLGFDLHLLGSENYVLAKLKALNGDDLETIRETFARNAHVRFLKVFSSNLPFGQKEEYRKQVKSADPKQLMGLIKISGFLMQTKVYLFWKKSAW